MRALVAVALVLLVPLAMAEQRIEGRDAVFLPERVLAGEWETLRWSWPADETHGIVSDATGEVWCAPATGGCVHFFAHEGTYAYRCPIHPEMRGSVLVERREDEANVSLHASFFFTVQGLTVTFDARSTSSRFAIDSYEWDFGDNATGRGRLVEHAYERAGEFIVRLTVIDEFGLEDTGARRVNVSIRGDTAASFRANATGVTVAFDAQPRAGTHTWDFGDGTVLACDAACPRRDDTAASSPTSVLHVYLRGGEFEVNHSVDDLWALSTVHVPGIQTFDVEADGLTLTLDASSLPRYGNATFLWRFGDVTNATGERVVHAFSKPGLWSIDLELVDDAGKQRLSREIPLTERVEEEPIERLGLLAGASASGHEERATPTPWWLAFAALAFAARRVSERYK